MLLSFCLIGYYLLIVIYIEFYVLIYEKYFEYVRIQSGNTYSKYGF